MRVDPLVSIVIPVYNGANYLREAIESVLSQTYTNCEVLVINDGSTDSGQTESIAHSYGDRIRYFSKENGGVSSALNLGIREMRGEYFAWLSHDDFYSANRIYEDIKIFQSQQDVNVTFCRVVTIDSMGKQINEHPYHVRAVENLSDALRSDSFNMCSLTINRICFEKIGLFDESNKMTQDIVMLLSLAKKFILFHNDKSILCMRDHENRGTRLLKKHHKIYQDDLVRFMKKNFSIDDFFPGINAQEIAVQVKAWTWMGDTYCFFGAFEEANECYFTVYRKSYCILSRVNIRYFIGARMLSYFLVIYFRINSIKVKKFIKNYFSIY